MPLETPARIVRELARRGYNAEREAVTLLAGAPDPAAALDAAVETAPDDALRLTTAHVRTMLDADQSCDDPASSADSAASTDATTTDDITTDTTATETGSSTDATLTPTDSPPSTTDSPPSTTDSPPSTTDSPTSSDAETTSPEDDESSPTDAASPTAPSVSTPASTTPSATQDTGSPVETKGSTHTAESSSDTEITVTGDITGRSTGTGEYDDFVSVFRDRYEKLSGQLRGRVNHRPASAIADMPGGSDVAMIGLVNDVRSSANGHWIIELEDTTGTFPCLITKDRDIAAVVDEILLDECLAIEGTLSDDAGIAFVDSLHFPDVPRTYRPNTADRHVQAALISDVHVGSQEFMADAWHRFTDWLHTDEADPVEYLLLAGDMVEGVGVYPDQDEELDIVDIYDQYEQFSEYLKEVPGDMEIVMIPGNHDAVRLAEPQPAFDEELRDIMSAHDARIVGNPSTVTVEGVSVLMYHGVSLDEVIAELPEEKASYEHPHRAMYHLLKKRHVAPKYGGHMRLAPEEADHLVIEDVPDVFHTGHVHKLGYGKYHNVLAVNSGCWQAQTAFQKSVNIDPDAGFAPILDLDTLDLTVRKFA
ncbi:DNA-directed DNA polymerase II small subunit [Haloplanus halobius]|uniref:DNA-directed DNA polymerase II small subunit n=1 Tax=Haloplanus halobius TaxID=2934938 RepID=UPI002010866A